MFRTNSLIKLFHIPGPMSCPYTIQSKTHIPTYPSMLPSTDCTFYWLWHVLVRESCLVLRPLSLGTIATCTMASEGPSKSPSNIHELTSRWSPQIHQAGRWMQQSKLMRTVYQRPGLLRDAKYDDFSTTIIVDKSIGTFYSILYFIVCTFWPRFFCISQLLDTKSCVYCLAYIFVFIQPLDYSLIACNASSDHIYERLGTTANNLIITRRYAAK